MLLVQEEAYAENSASFLRDWASEREVTPVFGVSYARHWAQKEDIWSANAVEGYWYAKPSMI